MLQLIHADSQRRQLRTSRVLAAGREVAKQLRVTSRPCPLALPRLPLSMLHAILVLTVVDEMCPFVNAAQRQTSGF